MKKPEIHLDPRAFKLITDVPKNLIVSLLYPRAVILKALNSISNFNFGLLTIPMLFADSFDDATFFFRLAFNPPEVAAKQMSNRLGLTAIAFTSACAMSYFGVE